MTASRDGAALRISLLYAAFGALWIIASDRILSALAGESAALVTRLQTVKGWAFVAATGLMLFFLVRRELRRREEAEASLSASERRFRDLLENVHLVAVMMDAKGGITFANDYLLRLAGWSLEEILGRNWFDLFIPSDQGVLEVFTDGLTRGEIARQVENDVLTRDGERRRIAWSNTLLRDAGGRAVGTASIGEDVTERRALQAQVLHAQKMEAIGTLAGGIAHDFNNLLAVIVGYAELAQLRQGAGEDCGGEIDKVLDASWRARDLIRQILAFGRNAEQERRRVDAAAAVREALRFLRAAIPATIEIREAIAPDTGAVLADPTQIHQVVVNLGTNAFHAMRETGGTLTVTVDRAELGEGSVRPLGLAPGRYVRFVVEDTGCGMEEEIQARIFDPYFTTKGVGEGSGLGLAVVDGIVKGHGGALAVGSRPGQGSRFEVYLPWSAETAETAEAPASSP